MTLRGIITFVISWAFAGVHAADIPSNSIPEHGIHQDELGHFAEEFFSEHLDEFDIPGAVFVVVANGDTLLASGYGVANRETQASVDPERTRFRVASIGKTFTALAVLQLVERGELDLLGNVNELLEDPIDDAGLGPITLHQLLLHTAGFDERLIGYLARPEQPESLGDYLSRRMPNRSFAPNDISRYSNHGYALAGLVVEQVSGRPFWRYAEEEIFDPLGMTRTAFLTLPLPEWTDELATEYWASGEIARPLVSNPYPAGSLATTGNDMRHFLSAFLSRSEDDASGARQRVLSDDILRRMQTVQYTPHPQLPGSLTYGMTRTKIHGRSVVLKWGSGPAHSAILGFLPDQGIGFFGAVNRQEPQIWTRLLPRLVEVMSKNPRVNVAVNASEASLDPRAAQGEYRLGRYAKNSIERLLSLAIHANVTAQGNDGVAVALPVDPSMGGDFDYVSGSAFRSRDGNRTITFSTTEGRVTHLHMDLLGEPISFEKVRWDESINTVLLALGTVILIFVTVAFASIIRGATSLFRRSVKKQSNRGEKITSWLATSSSIWSLAALIALVLALGKWKDWAQAAPGELIVAATMGTVVPLLALACTVGIGIAWQRSYWGILRRVHYTTCGLALVLFAALLMRYNVWFGGV